MTYSGVYMSRCVIMIKSLGIVIMIHLQAATPMILIKGCQRCHQYGVAE